MEKETIMIDGVRYYADRPRSCRGCYFWKNTVVTRTIQGLLRFPDILVTKTSHSKNGLRSLKTQ